MAARAAIDQLVSALWRAGLRSYSRHWYDGDSLSRPSAASACLRITPRDNNFVVLDEWSDSFERFEVTI